MDLRRLLYRLMEKPPRPRDEHVITKEMWISVALVGTVMAVGALLIFDASLPGGLIQGTADVRLGRTMAFTTLVFFQLFNVFNSRSGHQSAFADVQQNRFLIYAAVLSITLQVLADNVSFLQEAFETTSLSAWDWTVCVGIGSSVLWVIEAYKWIVRYGQL